MHDLLLINQDISEMSGEVLPLCLVRGCVVLIVFSFESSWVSRLLSLIMLETKNNGGMGRGNIGKVNVVWQGNVFL